jgi:hypothetical protein
MSKRTQSIVGSDMSAEIKALSTAIKALELLPYMIDILDTFAKTTEYSGTATLRRELIQKAKDVMQK